MRALVTGANGAIGSRLSQTIISNGGKLRALVRKTSDIHCLKNFDLEFCYGDVKDVESLDKALEDVDVVYHLAAVVPPRLWRVPRKAVWDVNVKGTLNLLEACRRRGVDRFVHASTIGVTGYINNGRVDESHPYNPQGLYEETKCEAEKLVLKYHKEYGVPSTVIRITAVYGPGLVHGMVKLFQAIQNRKFRFLGSGESLIHLIYIDDLVDAFLLAGKCEDAVGEVYIVGMKDPVTWKEYVGTIADAMEVDLPKGRVPIWLAKTLGSMSEIMLRPFSEDEPYLVRYRVDWTTKNSACDISKAAKELGFEPKTSLREGVEKTVKWYQENGYLK